MIEHVARVLVLLTVLVPGPTIAQPPQPPAAAAPAEDGNWTMPAKNYASTRFSGLDEINVSNANRLQLSFTFSSGVMRGHESAPLVVDGMLYFVSPFPNKLYALDLLTPETPLKWIYDPKPDPNAQGEACCDSVNRGPTYAQGKLFYNTLDNFAVAVDARDGREVWKVKLGDFTKGETMTMAPLVVKDKVLVGNSGGEFGVRGWLKALDIDTGAVAWTAYSTGPDRDVLIGSEYQPFYDYDRGPDLGVSSWPPDAWRQGGGAVWGWIGYDPELDLIYYGTSNPSPWNGQVRPGDNKFTAGIFARDPDTGMAHWFYQFSPHDLFDHDGVNEQILLDMTIDDRERRVLVRPERNGYIYIMDRMTGEVLSADAYVPITGSKGVDFNTGRLVYSEEKKPQLGRVVRNICPASPGAKDWNPSAYSPLTGLLYIPHNNMCMDWEETTVSYISGTPYIGAEAKYYAAEGGHKGAFTAWDPVARRKVWSIPEKYPLWSGAAATAGGVVFYGNLEGWFKAVDAKTGALLWQYKTESGIIGQPTVFRGPDGREYVAILSGIGGWAGSVVAADLDPRDDTMATGWGRAVRDLKQVSGKGGKLYVFSLPH
jgi:lanthanide-dependent methanol dehydrogenase